MIKLKEKQKAIRAGDPDDPEVCPMRELSCLLAKTVGLNGALNA